MSFACQPGLLEIVFTLISSCDFSEDSRTLGPRDVECLERLAGVPNAGVEAVWPGLVTGCGFQPHICHCATDDPAEVPPLLHHIGELSGLSSFLILTFSGSRLNRTV